MIEKEQNQIGSGYIDPIIEKFFQIKIEETYSGVSYGTRVYAERLGCEESDIALREGEITNSTRIFIGDFNGRNQEEIPVGMQIIFGDLDLRGSRVKHLGGLKGVVGNIDVCLDQIELIKKFKNIYCWAIWVSDLKEKRHILDPIPGNTSIFF